MLAIIGGSGLTRISTLSQTRRIAARTAFGEPSSPLTLGRLGESEVLFLARHGDGHRVPPHQVNYRIIESALKKLDVPESKIYMNLEKYGNTSAASVGIALDEARRAGRIPEGSMLSLIAFGAGLTWASALLKW